MHLSGIVLLTRDTTCPGERRFQEKYRRISGSEKKRPDCRNSNLQDSAGPRNGETSYLRRPAPVALLLKLPTVTARPVSMFVGGRNKIQLESLGLLFKHIPKHMIVGLLPNDLR